MAEVSLIVGMDRSGTSAAAAVAQIVGLHLGNQLIGPRKANPKGYFEDSRCVSINTALLSQLRHGRKFATPLPYDWMDSLPGRHAELRARGVVRRLATAKMPFGLKDPRLCLTAPLWVNIIEQESHNVQFVLCFRNPLEVAASLRKRDGRDLTGSCLIWLTHTLAALQASAGKPKFYLDYRSLMSDPVGTGGRLKGFVTGNREQFEANEDEKKKIEEFVDPNLWTNKVSPKHQNFIELAALQLYQALAREDENEISNFRSVGVGALIDRMNSHASMSLSRLTAIIRDSPESF